MTAIVDTPEEAAQLELRAAARPPAAGGVPRRPRAGLGRDRRRAGGRRALQRHLPDPPRRGRSGCCAARRAARCRRRAHDVLREARLLTAVRDAPVRTPAVLAVAEDEAVIGAPFYVMEKVRGRRHHHRDPARARRARGRAPAHRRGAHRRARGDPRRRLAGVRPGGLRQADGLPRAPAAALRRALGAQQDARGPEVLDRVDGVARRAPARVPPTRRSSTATTGSATRCTRPARPRGSCRSSTGSWRRSATRSPTSATWRRPTPSPATRRARSCRSGRSPASPGFPRREELIARYEERSGRSMSDVRWYTTLALWKSAIFLEGSYKRRAGRHDGRPVLRPARARRARDRRARVGRGPWRVSPAGSPGCSSTSAGS